MMGNVRVSATQETGQLFTSFGSRLYSDGCDSGKPATAFEAVTRWHMLRCRSGRLLTGHCVLDTRSGLHAAEVCATTVRFGTPDDSEIEAYVATGEPLRVAGAFTLDGYAAAFLAGIDGDAGNVVGLSLPLLRDLLGRLDVRLVDLWS